MANHKEYPRCLHKPGGATCLVESDEARDAKLAEGWSLLPVLDVPAPAAAPAPEPQADAEPIEADAPKKRGRKVTH